MIAVLMARPGVEGDSRLGELLEVERDE